MQVTQLKASREYNGTGRRLVASHDGPSIEVWQDGIDLVIVSEYKINVGISDDCKLTIRIEGDYV